MWGGVSVKGLVGLYSFQDIMDGAFLWFSALLLPAGPNQKRIFDEVSSK